MFGIGANPDDNRAQLAQDFRNLHLPWRSLVYSEVENASNYGQTGGDIAAIYYLVDPNGKIRFKRVVPFEEEPYISQREIDREINKLCTEFGISRRN